MSQEQHMGKRYNKNSYHVHDEHQTNKRSSNSSYSSRDHSNYVTMSHDDKKLGLRRHNHHTADLKITNDVSYKQGWRSGDKRYSGGGSYSDGQGINVDYANLISK
jgi:hypothetical protein